MGSATDARDWGRLKGLLADALERPPHERAAFVDGAAGGDAALARQLHALVAASDSGESILDTSPAGDMLDALDDASTQAWIGRRLGPYRLVRLIGGGGMGRVYLAERADGQYEQRVAVKLMRDGVDHAAFVARFKAERQILASLDHPNLAKILDGGLTDDGIPYFVMELVEGEPLDAFCRARELTVRERLRLMRSVCLVVHYAHQHGVVHRDLKPANILVTRDGSVKLVDFGIAKRLQAEAAAAAATATMQQVMTLEYASPEQVRGEPVTPASDVFSLGVVLYRVLTDASPYPAPTTDSSYALSRAICEAEPAAPSRGVRARSLRRQVAGDLDAVVLMALRKDPVYRYASAEQLADDLFRHLEGLPVQARRGAWSYRAGRFMLRHRLAVGAALVANLALVAALGLAAYEGLQATRQQQRAQRHFESVRKLANVFIADVYKELERLPGSLNARKTLVDTALAYLKQLHAEAQEDPSLQLELATGFGNIGDIQGAGTAASFGDTQGAMASYDSAQALLQGLRTGGPLEIQAQAEFVRLSARKGALLMALARWKDAEAIELEGLDVARALERTAPAEPRYRRLEAKQLRALASLYQRSSNAPAFEKTAAEAMRAFEALLASDPDDVDSLADLGTLHGLRAIHLKQNIGTPAARREALDEYNKALAIMGPAYQKHPLHGMLASNYGKISGYTGLLLTEMGRPREALEPLKRAVDISVALAAKDPGDVRTRTEQAEANGRLAEALLAVHEPAQAVAALRRSLALFASMPQATQDEVVIQFNIAETHHLAGLALQAMAERAPAGAQRAERAEACGHFRTGLQLFEENLKHRPASPMTSQVIQNSQQALRGCPREAGTDA